MKSFESTLFTDGSIQAFVPEVEEKEEKAIWRFHLNSQYWMHDLMIWEKGDEQYERRLEVNKATGQVDRFRCGEYDIV